MPGSVDQLGISAVNSSVTAKDEIKEG